MIFVDFVYIYLKINYFYNNLPANFVFLKNIFNSTGSNGISPVNKKKNTKISIY